MQATFEKDWAKCLQLCIIRNASFHGTFTFEGRPILIFRVSQKEPEKRYVWLSSADFWKCPVDIPKSETVYDHTHFPYKFFKNGPLKSSPGSIISSYWTGLAGSLKPTSETSFGQWSFQDLKSIAEELDFTLQGVKTGRDRLKSRDESILFHK